MTAPDPAVAQARAAGLRYSSDRRPGIRRRRVGRAFSYHDPDGIPVRDPDVLRRIRGIAIPPAWTDVWICPDPNGHLQATGRDARGRKQYRYHRAWRATRDAAKFDRLVELGRALPRIRRRVDADLARPGLPRQKVLALVTRLLELSLIRVGNDEYARLYGSFGLTTLRNRHARVEGGRIRFRFRGKSGVDQRVTVHDRHLARIVARCQELPGQDLFEYVDADGTARAVTSDDVNEYLRSVAGIDVTAKDFRTWAATVEAYRGLCGMPRSMGPAARRALAEVIAAVATRLGNTPAVCRSSYVHPAVVDAYLGGSLGRHRRRAADAGPVPPARRVELEVVRLLEQAAVVTRTEPAAGPA